MSSPNPSSAHPQRPPPPSLFLGPPSRNASNISLPPVALQSSSSANARAPLLRTRSALVSDTKPALGKTRPQAQSAARTEGDRADALWAEMQATLADVELNAFSSTHVFGAAHSAALDDLREAQMQLAQAWGRSGTDDDQSNKGTEGEEKSNHNDDKDTDENDILEARRRREANEKFFQKVREGVVDVVGKLEVVAAAMGKVEKESREIWSSSDSVGTGASTTS
ncbi:MAG: hypothetical protein LQ350_003029 [Teloschistes chrysophthalmus]|nr:MAG: hypothetical protein LQ350_003029 [Niorma chrysophthalma]